MSRNAASAGRSRLFAALWALCMLVAGAWLGVLASRGLPLETSVLAMLPESEQDPALHELSVALSGRAARTLLVLVGHDEREKALEAAAFAQKELEKSHEFSAIQGAFDAEKERAFFDLYFPHRYAMLSARMRADLEAGLGATGLVKRVRSLLQSPASSLYTGLLERDPLLLYPECMQGFAAAGAGGATAEGFLVFPEGSKTFALLAAESSADPFDANGQRAALDEIEKLRTALAGRFAGAELVYTGIPCFAARTREAMQRDIMIIGTGSMLGTALVILLVFRSMRPFILSFLPVAAGIAVATLVSFLVFRRVHVLTLVFGTSLTGLGVDYALHYFAVHRMWSGEWDAQKGMRDILPGITLGVLTSVVGFSGLYFTAFPVLRQFALFSSVGLVGAWATVVCWYPPLSSRGDRHTDAPWLHGRCQAFLDLWSRLRWHRSARVALLAVCAAALAACFTLRFEDDVRKFQSSPGELLAESQRVRKIAGGTDDGRFVLVEGASEEQTLERVEEASTLVRAAIDAGSLDSCRDLSLFLPSRARQERDRELLAGTLVPQFDALRAGLDDLGLDAAVIDELQRALQSPPSHPLDVDAWLASPASEALRPLWLGRTAHGFGASLLLGSVREGAALEARLAGHAGIHYVDRVRDMSALLTRYRIDTIRLVALAYAGVLLALMLRFGARGGVRVMLPSLLAAGLTLSILGAAGAELNLFHVLGLLLVLGLAVDYGVIFAENATSEATTLFAVALSVLTTVTAFGLMVSSSAPPLRSLGASVSIGIVLALVLSPLASPGSKRTAPHASTL